MSGGAFAYAYVRVINFVDALEVRLEGEHGLNDDTVALLRKTIDSLRKAHQDMKNIEWLFSGDISEESFNRRMLE